MQTNQNEGSLVSKIFAFFKSEDLETNDNKEKSVDDYQCEMDDIADYPEESPNTTILEAIRTTLLEEEHLKEIREQLRRNSTSNRRNSNENQ